MRKSRKLRKSRSMRKSRKLRKSKTMRKSRKLRKSKSMRKSRYRTHRQGGGFLGGDNNYDSNQQIMLGLISQENKKLDKIINFNDKLFNVKKSATADQSLTRAYAYQEFLNNVGYSIKNNKNLLMPDVNDVDKKDYSNRLADVNKQFMNFNEGLKIEEIYCILNVKPGEYLGEYINLGNECKQSESVYKIYQSLFIKAPSSVFVDLSDDVAAAAADGDEDDENAGYMDN